MRHFMTACACKLNAAKILLYVESHIATEALFYVVWDWNIY